MNELAIQSLMDPAGAPSHPILFLVLGVVTFALHMTAVSVMLGSLVLAIIGTIKSTANWRRLVPVLAYTSKVGLTAALVLGVAPLLFVQVIYDPFWYYSSVVSAWWTLVFLAVLTLAYLMLFRFNSVTHIGSPETAGSVWLYLAIVCLVACGVMMHGFSLQAQLPSEWMGWYAPGGVVDTSGRTLHAISCPRVAFFLSLSLPVTAGWLYGYKRYIASGGETDEAYLGFVESVASRAALVGAALLAVFSIVWMVTLPESMAWFATSPWIVAGVLPVVFFGALPAFRVKFASSPACDYLAFVLSLVMVILAGVAREALRFGTLLGEVGWNPLDYKITMDWPTTIIFFVTFLVVGGVNLAFLLTVAWKSGQVKGIFTVEGPLAKLGALSVGLIAAWMAAYFVIGLVTMA